MNACGDGEYSSSAATFFSNSFVMQGLKKMENLFLPGLKELYLHQNKIAKIDGLQG